MNFVESIKFGFSNYVNFQGRSRRSGFWYWYLFTVLVSLVFNVLSGGKSESFFGFLGGLAALAIFLPSLAYSVRRLHDINKSGWFILFALIPLVGWIFLLVWYVKDSDPTDNRFGPNPKAA
ncbi:uncharacterized membrane protein YhaH (DUF805 family) [Aurantimicrobium minutum]|uniref:DUF805 domain-containing protein n=1 Tax=Aurantimicrobium minutum TaxID=708131 RepID=UPI002476FE20|nr:DUF805 domain-containing protein [Aurantimicrobium minutum]MDH6255682.1 uncharacterized membrane protein YhaH (DUF805 family) [Aurantimicrobium minutum]MDH6424450.1 uncharacterized membrane protein YhaH (DUF805 family) [Aurantimicrobium minutum]